jgi:hypothetical protein
MTSEIAGPLPLDVADACRVAAAMASGGFEPAGRC